MWAKSCYTFFDDNVVSKCVNTFIRAQVTKPIFSSMYIYFHVEQIEWFKITYVIWNIFWNWLWRCGVLHCIIALHTHTHTHAHFVTIMEIYRRWHCCQTDEDQANLITPNTSIPTRITEISRIILAWILVSQIDNGEKKVDIDRYTNVANLPHAEKLQICVTLSYWKINCLNFDDIIGLNRLCRCTIVNVQTLEAGFLSHSLSFYGV